MLLMSQAAEWHKSESTFHLESSLKCCTEMCLIFRDVGYRGYIKMLFRRVARRPFTPSGLLLSAGLLLRFYQVSGSGFG